MSRIRRHGEDALLGAVGLGLSLHAFFSVTTVGDYPGDAGRAISALLHGDLGAFGRARPAMGDLSLLVRAPFAELAYLGRPTPLSIYRWGVLPCVLAVALLGLWLARRARSRGVGLPGQLAIVALCLENPLTSSAIALGHPEELLTAALCVAALIAALGQRPLLTAVLLGLALACKEWSLVAVLPILLALQRGRMRALLSGVAVAVLVTVPEVLAAPITYLRNQVSLAHVAGGSTELSWWFPFASESTASGLVHGFRTTATLHRIPAAVAHSLQAIIVGVDAALALGVARVRGLELTKDDAFALLAAVLLLRCTLDTETMPYYYTPLLLDLLAWDAYTARGLPLRALCGAALSWVLFDRLTPAEVGVLASSIIYGASMAVVFALLLRKLLAKRRAGEASVHVSEPDRATALAA